MHVSSVMVMSSPLLETVVEGRMRVVWERMELSEVNATKFLSWLLLLLGTVEENVWRRRSW